MVLIACLRPRVTWPSRCIFWPNTTTYKIVSEAREGVGAWEGEEAICRATPMVHLIPTECVTGAARGGGSDL